MTPDLMKFLVVIAKAGIVLLTYLFCAVSLYGLSRRMVRTGQYAGVILGICFVVGPVLMGWFLTMLLLTMPGQSRLFYCLVPLLPFAALLLINARFLCRSVVMDTSGWQYITQSGLERYLWTAIAGFLLVVALGGLVAVVATTPMHGNDAIEYQIVARSVAIARDANIYPIVDSDVALGFKAPWTHPMGYIGLLSHAYIVMLFDVINGWTRLNNTLSSRELIGQTTICADR